ncbi:MAG: DUF799 family lipoprotein [Magnetococcus sp. DMHC-1]
MRRNNLVRGCWFGIFLLLLSGCVGEKVPPEGGVSVADQHAAGTVQEKAGASQGTDVPDRNRTDREKAAAVRDQGKTQPDLDLPHKVAVLPFRNLSPDPEAGEAVRKLFFNFFSTLNYNDLELFTVDRLLRENHLYDPLLQGREVSLEQVCQFLGVDGLVRAEVKDYGKMYVLLYSQRQVSVKAELLHCRGPRPIWTKESTVTDRDGGVSLDPAGLALSMIKTFVSHQGASLLQTTVKLCMEMMPDVPNPKEVTDPPPRITLMVHNGAGRFLLPGQSLRVVLVGDPGMTGSWDIGPTITNLPLQEKSPGMYVGAFQIREKDRIINTLPVARLATRSGVVNRWMDILGGVNLGRLEALPQMVDKDLTLTAANSPYLIHPILMVRAGATLTLEPGTVIWVRGKGIVVKGAIVARGTEENQIRLLSAGAEIPWEGIFLDQTQRPNLFENIVITGARYGINARNSRVTMQHGMVRNNTWGVVMDGGELELRDSHIRDSEKTGLALKDGKGIILANRITDNRGGGIHLRKSEARIEGNDIYGNVPWEIRNQESGDPLKAPQNWWGRTNIEEIPLQGTVDFNPVLEHPVATSVAKP